MGANQAMKNCVVEPKSIHSGDFHSVFHFSTSPRVEGSNNQTLHPMLVLPMICSSSWPWRAELCNLAVLTLQPVTAQSVLSSVRRCGRLLPLHLLVVLAAGALGQESAQVPTAVPNVSSPAPWMRDPEKVHDPSTIILTHGVRRFFCTGPGVLLMREDAQGKWIPEGRLFAQGKYPAWHEQLVPGNRGYLWAPDVIQIREKFLVYYSVSTFGKNTSAIGLAVGAGLDPSSPQWQWEDRGPVFTSGRQDRFNAIDPAIFRDSSDGALWMAFGSFWDGIHLVGLDPSTGLRRDPKDNPVRLASAPEIEAPFLHQRDGYYYLFLNWGKCCRGVNSTYEIRVGRSRSVAGPYIDRSGTDLREAGGTLVLAGEDRWIGPGHASIFSHDGHEWLVHHYYDRELGGRSRLRMVPLTWDPEGWPLVTSEP
jgi:arabinan endo-1,5-alpha-L-arabinosidase